MRRGRARAAALALALAWALPAAAADPGSGLLAKARRLLPERWTLRTAGLPDGVAAVALGPASAKGRAVVSVRPWTLPDLPDDPQVAEALAERLGPGDGAALRRAARGPLGWELDTEGPDGLVTRFILHPLALVTLTTPEAELDATYRQILDAAEALGPALSGV